MKQDEFHLLCNGLWPKIVKDNELCFFEEVEPFNEGFVGFCYCNLFTESVEVKVERSVAVGASLMSQCTSEEGFSTAGGAGDEDVFGTCQVGVVSRLGERLGLEVSLF